MHRLLSHLICAMSAFALMSTTMPAAAQNAPETTRSAPPAIPVQILRALPVVKPVLVMPQETAPEEGSDAQRTQMGHAASEERLTDCPAIHDYGSSEAGNANTLHMLNAEISGRRLSINNRKQLDIHRVSSVGFRGCEITVRMDVTLKRKVRKDADGFIDVKAETYLLTNDRLCFREARITEVELSNLRAIGEDFAGVLLKDIFKGNSCYGTRR